MDRTEALEGLNSDRVSSRLEAARALASLALPKDRAILETYRRSEAVPWIRSALGRAVARASVPPEQAGEVVAVRTSGDIDDHGGSEAIYAAALQEAADRFVHELRKPVGRARLYAEKEIVDHENSRTYKELGRLQEFLVGIQALGTAAGAARLTEVDLSALLEEEADAVGELDGAFRIELRGPERLSVIADAALVRLATSNALKNAAEAVASIGSDEQIIVSWGETDLEYYVVILDRGPGVPPVAEPLFEIGASSKRGHVGLGLAIARQASRSLGGEIVLSNLDEGLTRFEMRWPKHEVIA